MRAGLCVETGNLKEKDDERTSCGRADNIKMGVKNMMRDGLD